MLIASHRIMFIWFHLWTMALFFLFFSGVFFLFVYLIFKNMSVFLSICATYSYLWFWADWVYSLPYGECCLVEDISVGFSTSQYDNKNTISTFIYFYLFLLPFLIFAELIFQESWGAKFSECLCAQKWFYFPLKLKWHPGFEIISPHPTPGCRSEIC